VCAGAGRGVHGGRVPVYRRETDPVPPRIAPVMF
jgi:hypothetical protein